MGAFAYYNSTVGFRLDTLNLGVLHTSGSDEINREYQSALETIKIIHAEEDPRRILLLEMFDLPVMRRRSQYHTPEQAIWFFKSTGARMIFPS